MKTLNQFISEQLTTYRVVDLEIVYLCKPDEKYITFEVPEAYTEDNFTLYLQDKYLNDLPGNTNNSKELFKKNSAKIYDALFEYDKYEKSDKSDEEYIEFDVNLDSNFHKDEDEKFSYIKVYGLRYILKFESFDLNVESVDDIKDTLIDIFKAYESNDGNEYPIEISLDEENIKYK